MKVLSFIIELVIFIIILPVVFFFALIEGVKYLNAVIQEKACKSMSFEDRCRMTSRYLRRARHAGPRTQDKK